MKSLKKLCSDIDGRQTMLSAQDIRQDMSMLKNLRQSRMLFAGNESGVHFTADYGFSGNLDVIPERASVNESLIDTHSEKEWH